MEIIIPEDDTFHGPVETVYERLRISGHWNKLIKEAEKVLPKERENTAQAVVFMAAYDWASSQRHVALGLNKTNAEIYEDLGERLERAAKKLKEHYSVNASVITIPPREIDLEP